MDLPGLLPYLLFAISGLLLGFLLAWFYLRLGLEKSHMYREEVNKDYVRRELHEQLRNDHDLQYENLQEKSQAETKLHARLAGLNAEHQAVLARLDDRQREMQRLQTESLAQFERTAEKLFQEKSDRFRQASSQQLDGILQPLKERIQGFEHQVERRFLEETKDRVSLRQEIIHLKQLNAQISTEANNLAGALRGSSKIQGDWGEWQLRTLLESSGLERGIHFSEQNSYRDEEGRQKRPDFIIHLPEDKHLVIDSKVSLIAYERYHGCEESASTDRKREAAAHLLSLRKHVSDLASKNYTRLYQINSPDYLLLFVPIEPALALALSTDRNLFLEALEKNIVLVSPATLLATLRTVGYIWKQENQKNNVLEIARQSGLLYDGFVAFTADLKKIGQRLDQAQSSYHGALIKLSTGGKYGATLIGRAEKLRKLGAKTKKRIDKSLLEEE